MKLLKRMWRAYWTLVWETPKKDEADIVSEW